MTGGLLIGLLALAGLAVSMGGKKPDGAPAVPAGGSDLQWDGFAAQALATRHPQVIRYAAQQLRGAGKIVQAQALEVAADAIDSANAAAAPSASGDTIAQTPGVVAQAQQAAQATLPALSPAVQQQVQDALAAAQATAAQAQQAAASGEPVAPVAATPVSSDPKVAAAESLANHLRATGRFREDKDRVKAFQVMVGQNPDGSYGVATAIAIGDLGVIPAKPFYYPSKASDVSRAKSKWRGYCVEKMQTDPAHSVQWETLSKVDRD